MSVPVRFVYTLPSSRLLLQLLYSDYYLCFCSSIILSIYIYIYVYINAVEYFGETCLRLYFQLIIPKQQMKGSEPDWANLGFGQTPNIDY